MRTYNTVPRDIWIKPQYRVLDDDARVLLFYLSTNSHTNLLGCYRLPCCMMENELRWSRERLFRSRLALMDRELVDCDSFSEWIWIKSFLSWNPINNTSQGKGLAKQFALVPSQVTFYQDLVTYLLSYKKNLTPAFLQELNTLLPSAIEEDKPEALNSVLHPASQLTFTINAKDIHLHQA